MIALCRLKKTIWQKIGSAQIRSLRTRHQKALQPHVKYNVWTGMWTHDQVVIVIAGSNRSNTQAAEARQSEAVKSRVLG